MNIVTLFYMRLYTFINIPVHKVALVNPNNFITILLNNHLKAKKITLTTIMPVQLQVTTITY